MLRRLIPRRLASVSALTLTLRTAADWQARPKHQQRFSKRALMQSRARFQEQKATSALRQQINESHGELQEKRSKLRHHYEHIAFDLVNRAGKGPSASAEQSMATARHMLMMNEAARKAMKNGRRERKNAFISSKRWRG